MDDLEGPPWLPFDAIVFEEIDLMNHDRDRRCLQLRLVSGGDCGVRGDGAKRGGCLPGLRCLRRRPRVREDNCGGGGGGGRGGHEEEHSAAFEEAKSSGGSGGGGVATPVGRRQVPSVQISTGEAGRADSLPSPMTPNRLSLMGPTRYQAKAFTFDVLPEEALDGATEDHSDGGADGSTGEVKDGGPGGLDWRLSDDSLCSSSSGTDGDGVRRRDDGAEGDEEVSAALAAKADAFSPSQSPLRTPRLDRAASALAHGGARAHASAAGTAAPLSAGWNPVQAALAESDFGRLVVSWFGDEEKKQAPAAPAAAAATAASGAPTTPTGASRRRSDIAVSPSTLSSHGSSIGSDGSPRQPETTVASPFSLVDRGSGWFEWQGGWFGGPDASPDAGGKMAAGAASGGDGGGGGGGDGDGPIFLGMPLPFGTPFGRAERAPGVTESGGAKGGASKGSLATRDAPEGEDFLATLLDFHRLDFGGGVDAPGAASAVVRPGSGEPDSPQELADFDEDEGVDISSAAAAAAAAASGPAGRHVEWAAAADASSPRPALRHRSSSAPVSFLPDGAGAGRAAQTGGPFSPAPASPLALGQRAPEEHSRRHSSTSSAGPESPPGGASTSAAGSARRVRIESSGSVGRRSSAEESDEPHSENEGGGGGGGGGAPRWRSSRESPGLPGGSTSLRSLRQSSSSSAGRLSFDEPHTDASGASGGGTRVIRRASTGGSGGGSSSNTSLRAEGAAPLAMPAFPTFVPPAAANLPRSVDLVRAASQAALPKDASARDAAAQGLCRAAAEGSVAACEALLAARGSGACDVDASRPDDGRTPLALAAQGGHVGVMKLLVARGADVDKPGKYGSTPLYLAAQEGHLEAVEVLLEVAASVGLSTTDGTAPLHAAAFNGHVDVVALLLAAGADCNLRNKYGRTPLDAAAGNEHADVVELLHAHRAGRRAQPPRSPDAAPHDGE